MTIEAIVITKITAIPIPRAESMFFETPIYGQIPKNLDSTKLLINIAVIRIKNKDDSDSRKIIQLLKFIGLFALIYLLLLPLGGYREYRPYIIRRDTFMPIWMLLFFFYGITTLHIVKNVRMKLKKFYYLVLLFDFINNSFEGFRMIHC